MKNVLRAVSRLAGIAAIFLVAISAHRAWAQAEPSQQPSTKPLATTFNPATDKLDRTTAGPITRPMIVEIAYNTYFFNEFGMDSQYLLVGSDRALLIDTGSGFYDLKGTVEKLTKLPYDVVVTHGHPDHAGGIGQFDTVWMDPADIPMLSHITEQGEKRYGEIMWNMPVGYKDVWGYTPADAKWGGWDKHPAIKALYDGQIFDLGGGRIVTVYQIAGHTPGSCVFLDHKTHIVFTGDAANRNLVASAVPVSTMIRNLLKLRNLRTDYDRIYNGHTAYGGTIDALPENPEILDDLIEAYREVLRGDAKLVVVPNHLFPSMSSTVAVYGIVQAGYNPKKLWEPDEQHIIP